jgi:hypothetical protein
MSKVEISAEPDNLFLRRLVSALRNKTPISWHQIDDRAFRRNASHRAEYRKHRHQAEFTEA